MTQQELFSDLLTAQLGGDDLVYVERRGEEYAWQCARLHRDAAAPWTREENFPDAWIYYSGQWPPPAPMDNPQWRAFFQDLLAEMESMFNGADRCRWPLDEPWSHH